MRIVKLGLISIVFFSLLLTLLSFFFPSRIRISKAIDINCDRAAVLQQVQDPAYWRNWYPGGDSLSPVIRNGKPVGILTGRDHSLILTGFNDSSIRAEDRGPRSARTESGWNLIPAATPRGVTLQWYMDFHLRWYPWEKFSSLLLEKRYGPLMEQGLARLKELLEK